MSPEAITVRPARRDDWPRMAELDRQLAVFEKLTPPNDAEAARLAAMIFDEKKIIVVKSNQAHRASLRPVVSRIIELASPGASTVDYESLPFRHIQRPLWPIDRDFDWSANAGR